MGQRNSQKFWASLRDRLLKKAKGRSTGEAVNGGHCPMTSPAGKRCIAISVHWQRKEIWQQIYQVLCQDLRRKMGREMPSAAVIDSQSVKTGAKRCGMHCRQSWN